jgi:hypothetical protein
MVLRCVIFCTMKSQDVVPSDKIGGSFLNSRRFFSSSATPSEDAVLFSAFARRLRSGAVLPDPRYIAGGTSLTLRAFVLTLQGGLRVLPEYAQAPVSVVVQSHLTTRIVAVRFDQKLGGLVVEAVV